MSGLLQAAPESGEDCVDDPLEEPLDDPVGEAPDEEQVVSKLGKENTGRNNCILNIFSIMKQGPRKILKVVGAETQIP